MDREELHRHLKEHSRVLEKEGLDKAFRAIDREDFVGDDYKVEAYEDYALPIGFGQTISQPTTVAFMLELLDVQPDQTVLDVGSGSGWTTALLSDLVGEEGAVLGIEIIPELVELGRQNIARYNFIQTEIRNADEADEAETYDKILVSAAAESLPESLIEKLRSGGTMVIPIGTSIFQITKDESGETSEKEFPGFSFVPYIEEND